MIAPRFRSLAVRVTVFAIACGFLVVLAHAIVMPRMGRSELHDHFTDDQRALAALVGMIDGRDLRAPGSAAAWRRGGIDDSSDAEAVVAQLAATRHIDSALVTREGRVLAVSGRPFAALDRDTLAALDRTGVSAIGDDVVALAIPGRGAFAGDVLLVRASPPTIPLEAALVVIGLMLAMIAAASLWFARSLARPLASLARAAERLGGGDLSARAGLARRDELGQVGQAFDAMAQRIADLLDANRALIANVSHELRTPMARIRVALELANDSPEEAKELLVGVGGDLGELERLVEDVLTMTRLGAMPVRRERCSPRDVADQAAERWRQLHRPRVLTPEVAADAPPFEGDPVLVRRVVDNLLDNAAKYSPPDEPVVLRVARADGQVRFEVIDRGAGMSADELAHAFAPFWRADTSRTRETGGVGLGLALARQIARAHGGEVALESEPGEGTRAVLVVPAA